MLKRTILLENKTSVSTKNLQIVIKTEVRETTIPAEDIGYVVIDVSAEDAQAAELRTALAAMGLILPVALFGAFTAARQSWLQWYPPEFYSCGRDFYGMIEQLPLSQALPRIFAGSGDCTAIDWTFLGGTIANWSFVGFAAIVLVCLGWFRTALRRR